MNHHYDIVIIGSGAGGGTMARALAGGAASVLLLERGDFLPREDENWDPKAVWVDRRYHATERWLDRSSREFLPHLHYCVGGNTKFWGSALFRLRREDFQELEHEGGVSPAWPIDYDALAPYYERAERLYQVHGEAGIDPTEPEREPYPHSPVPHSPAMASTVEQLRQQGTVGIEAILRRLATGDGFTLLLALANIGLCIGGKVFRQIAGKATAKLGLLLRIRPGIGAHRLFPVLLRTGTPVTIIPARVNIIGYFKGRVIPADILPGGSYFRIAQGRPVHGFAALLVGCTLADNGLAANQCGPGGLLTGLFDRRGNGGGVMTVDLGNHLPAVGFKACRRIVGKPAFDRTVDGNTIVIIEGRQLAQAQGSRE